MPRLATRLRVRTLETLAGVVRELELVAGHSLQEYREGVYVRRAAERLVQLAVDLACELGLSVLHEEQRRLPGGPEETFSELAKADLLPAPLADKMAAVVALRRRILFGWPVQPDEDEELSKALDAPLRRGGRTDPDEDLHRRLPFLAVLLREYGRHMEELMSSSRA